MNTLLEESAIAHAKQNQTLALEKAKEAAKRERKLTKYRDSNNMTEMQNAELTYPYLAFPSRFHFVFVDRLIVMVLYSI